MSARRSFYGEFEPRDVAAGFARQVLQTLGRRADENIAAEIARNAFQILRAHDLIGSAQGLTRVL